jgi:AhpC/TSA family
MRYSQEKDCLVKRHWNVPIWAGFAIVIVALVSYIPVFAVFPVTRDVPWANYLLFLLGGGLLAVGVRRALRDPEHYRGKISGSTLAVLSVLLLGFFIVGTVYLTKQIPSAERALRAGQPAPSFVLQDIAGKQVASSDLLKGHRAVVLVFYRGYW